MGLEAGLFRDIVTVFVAAFVGGWCARLAKLPTLLGYLTVGMIVGPFALGLVGDVEAVRTLAELGVILLLFAVGVEIDPSDVLKLGRRMILAGLGQLLFTGVAGFALGLALKWTVQQSLLLSFVLSLSSTMVVLKVLGDRGEMQTLHARVMTGILVMQDLAFVPMIAVVPALAGNSDGIALQITLSGLKAAGVLAVVFIFGGRLIPWLLRHAAGLGAQETFIVTVVAITVGAAAATQAAGLSAALGAFGAGLAISGSDWTGHRALQEVMPLRDIFAAMFFASLGMLVDPSFLVDNWQLVAVIIVFAMLFKFLVVLAVVRGVGYLPRTAVLSGFAMVQIGEFSFILAGAAETQGIVDSTFLPLVVVATVATMALTPASIASGSALVGKLESRWPWLRAYLPGASAQSETLVPRYRDHVVLVGLGRVGAFIAEELNHHGIPFIGIDIDPASVERVKSRWGYAIQGDATSQAVVAAARTRNAKLLVVATADPVSAAVTVQHARALNPTLKIVARVGWRTEADAFRRQHVQAIVWPEMEAALEMLRLSLGELGMGEGHIHDLVGTARRTLEFGHGEHDGGDPYAGLW